MDDLFLTGRDVPPGFRLHKLEVYNWGTFDSTTGYVHTVQPAGATTLLIGQNGSGKSTLVDALLTLLVKPGVRNFNVAAGAQKRERDERTYIKGAYGRFSRDEDNRADVQFLRPGGSHYSALLACFRNELCDEAFTVAQLLYLNCEGRAEKTYCISQGERSIAADLAGLTTTERVKQQMKRRGFRATSTYAEYHRWFVKQTGVRPKAMGMFNQTVAVKDIQSLNRFIRDHMLEAAPWGEKVESLLNHFTQLSEAHQSLVRVRRQFDLLEPIAKKGATYQEQAEQLGRIERLLRAADSFFRQKTVELFTPKCETQREELGRVQEKKKQLGHAISETQEECRRLKNEIEQAGGERLRQIPLLLDTHEKQAAAKLETNRRFHEALRAADVADTATDANTFVAIRQQLPALLETLTQQITKGESQRDERVIERGELARGLKEDERELQALTQRQGNLPEAFAELRRRLCEDLRLQEKELPFAAEVIAVKTDHREWQSSIEMVLRGFALSLLVPDRHYRIVSGYVNRTRLIDERGRGQRLVYLQVGERSASSVAPALHPHSLLRKLDFNSRHPLLPWVKGELEQRFDYRCCDTLEEFQAAQGLALTQQRHLKIRGRRHEKDDRDRTVDPRNFVLGWDNREKCRHLAQEINRRREQSDHLDRRVARIEREVTHLRDQSTAVLRAQEAKDFTDIDYATHQREIESLRIEKQRLEEQSDTIRLLKERLAQAESKQEALTAERDQVVGSERELTNSVQSGEQLIQNAEKTLRGREAEDTLALHVESFGDLEACFVQEPLTADSLLEQERAFMKGRNADRDHLRQEIEPLRNELTTAMNRFLREFPDERADLDANVEYLDSFLTLREYICQEDLPRHEQRFKERLNEKVTQEIGLLHGALQSERSEIVSKIDVLNESLRQLEYRPGTFMQLEPRPVRDREIAEFQDAMKECLAGTFEGTQEADEARYLRIEKLIGRLREEQRWRDKVTDVRRWFDFVAREIDDTTGEERGYHEDSTGQSGGEKAKLAFTILVAAIAYQYDIDPEQPANGRFHFVVVDEMFSKVDDQYAEYALELFQKFGLQLLIVAPLDAKARVTEPYVGSYLHVMKDAGTSHSEIFSMTAREFEETLVGAGGNGTVSDLSESAVRKQLPR